MRPSANERASHVDDLSKSDDRELVRRCREGDRPCFAELVSRHGGAVLSFLVRRTGNAHDAEDLFQDTFTRAWQRMELYDPTWKFRTWLFVIARRLAAGRFLAMARRKPATAESPEAGAIAADCEDPAATASRNEERGALWSLAGRALSAAQFECLWLRYAEGMAMREIARATGRTQSHVKVLLYRARLRLATCLRPADEAERAKEGARCSAQSTGF